MTGACCRKCQFYELTAVGKCEIHGHYPAAGGLCPKFRSKEGGGKPRFCALSEDIDVMADALVYKLEMFSQTFWYFTGGEEVYESREEAKAAAKEWLKLSDER